MNSLFSLFSLISLFDLAVEPASVDLSVFISVGRRGLPFEKFEMFVLFAWDNKPVPSSYVVCLS